MLGSCVTSYDKCCIIFRPRAVTYVFWIMSKNKKGECLSKWNYKSHSLSLFLSSLSLRQFPKKKNTRIVFLCGVRRETFNREIGRKSWCHNGARDRKVGEVERKMGFQKFSLARLPQKFPFAPDRIKPRRQKKKKTKFPYLHHQLHYTVDEPQQCRHGNSRWTSDAFACAYPYTLINLVDAAGCLCDHADVKYVRTNRCCENSAHRALVNWMIRNDDAACCRWYDCVYDVTSYMAVLRDPLMYTTRRGDIPAILPMRLQLV